MRPARVKCPAKLNLYLDISFRMPNGYHIMEMVMQTVNLFDTVYLTLRDDSEIHLTMDNSDIPTDETNIAWRCARALLDAAGSREGVNIRIHKQIPAQAGLGGGSADGAGVLVGLNALLNSPLSEKALCDLGAKIGADIPFCLVGGTGGGRGYGEIIEPIDPLPPCHILIAKPAVGISTAACFARYDESGIRWHFPVHRRSRQPFRRGISPRSGRVSTMCWNGSATARRSTISSRRCSPAGPQAA